jgi:hypothetical protein
MKHTLFVVLLLSSFLLSADKPYRTGHYGGSATGANGVWINGVSCDTSFTNCTGGIYQGTSTSAQINDPETGVAYAFSVKANDPLLKLAPGIELPYRIEGRSTKLDLYVRLPDGKQRKYRIEFYDEQAGSRIAACQQKLGVPACAPWY